MGYPFVVLVVQVSLNPFEIRLSFRQRRITMNIELERAAFKNHYREVLDLTETTDVRGQPQFALEFVEAMWNGWKDQAALEAQSRSAEINRDLMAERDALRKALKELISWFPSADTYRRLGFESDAPMRALKMARAALKQGVQ
jgi:hypothetical protein